MRRKATFTPVAASRQRKNLIGDEAILRGDRLCAIPMRRKNSCGNPNLSAYVFRTALSNKRLISDQNGVTGLNP